MHNRQMILLTKIVILLALFAPVTAFGFFGGGGGTLVTINGVKHSSQDYKEWWDFWKEKDSVTPEDPGEYVDWLLMAQQAKEMELFKNPTYKSKVQVFLKVRGLMFLKNEEIDSKMHVGEREIKEYYEKRYLPIFNTQVLFFDDLTKAEKAYEELKVYDDQEAGRLFFADQKGVSSEAGGPIYYRESVVRPVSFAKSPASLKWIEVLRSLDTEQLSKPFKVGKNYVLARLIRRESPEADDFEKFKAKARAGLWKEQQGGFTRDLLAQLKEKYKVVVHEELLDKLTPDEEFTPEQLEEVVLEIGEMSLTTGYMLERIKKHRAWRKTNFQAKSEFEKAKWSVVSGIISQTLIDWESLDRHYEKKEPLKKLYEFYKGNRLVEELASSFRAGIKASDVEIEDYYKSHEEEYVQPPTADYAIFVEEEKLINKIWAGVIQGSEFDDLIGNYYSRKVKKIHKKDNAIAPAVMTVLNTLAKGEVSAPFSLDGRYAMVKLLGRDKKNVKSLALVRDEIEKLLIKNKYEKSKNQYLTKLKEKSEISVNTNIWNNIKRDFGESTNVN